MDAANQKPEHSSRRAVAPRDTQSPDSSTHSESGSAGHPRNLPENFGRYRVIRKLGQGGMGAVYLAEDTQLERQVALKVPHFSSDDGPDILDRFLREAKAAATLHHPNLCAVHDVGQIDGVHYLTMAYIEGQPLSKFVRPDNPVPERQAAGVVRKLAIALAEAHAKGVIHRDLKPANVMIDQRREPIIMDFGLARRENKQDARITKSGHIVGTPAYMAPEQIKSGGGDPGASCDIYALGVILYELLTGKLPFEGNTLAILGQVLTADIEPPSTRRPGLDPALDAICMQALQKQPADRFANMQDLAQALTDWLKGDASSPDLTATPAESEQSAAPSEAAAEFFDNLPMSGEAPRVVSKKHSRGRRRSRKKSPVGLWIVGGLAALAVIVALAVVIFVQTPEGTISITLSDPDADVDVKVDGNVVSLDGLSQPLQLTVREHHLLVTGEGFETVSESFTVRDGENPQLVVDLVPVDESASVATIAPEDLIREHVALPATPASEESPLVTQTESPVTEMPDEEPSPAIDTGTGTGTPSTSPPVAPEDDAHRLIKVGSEPDMVATLKEAFDSAEGGGTIEIHTDDPLVIEPDQCVWDAKRGSLTIRAGEGFQPVLARLPGAAGDLLSFPNPSENPEPLVVLEGLTFVNTAPNNTAMHLVANSKTALTVRHCLFVCETTVIDVGRDSGLALPVTIQDCYFWRPPTTNTHGVIGTLGGDLNLENNLLVNVMPVTLAPTRATARNNTFLHIVAPFNFYLPSELQFADNVVAGANAMIVFGPAGAIQDFDQARERITAYSASNNLYFRVPIRIENGAGYVNGIDGLADWQRLTDQGEVDPIETDPQFVSNQAVELAKQRLQAPQALRFSSRSVASRRSLGADVSRLPDLPRRLRLVLPSQWLAP